MHARSDSRTVANSTSPARPVLGRLALLCLALLLCAGCGRPDPALEAPPPPALAKTDALDRPRALLRPGAEHDAQAALDLLEGRAEPPARLLAVQALRQLDRLNESVAEANRLILREPRLGAAFVERGLTLSALGHAERALEDLDAALMLDPTNAAALLARGDLYFLLELPDLAEESYSRAIALEPGIPLGWINRGVARDEQGRFTEAIADFTKALDLDPTQASAFENRGVSRSQLGDMTGMCLDYARACALGHCRRLTDARSMGYCATP
ncbi:MAG: tetratricopeptide repeat protein [Humidesulfovibrio sp.]|uniref:tetratricopeptide repeat protein n=1 Tax=Humidesulfovibrio sp. TaxID=2910988 RepID=UPI0027369B19|nr:tetratricopeptide repeat protein [Humidesulfovibrio sp.]MDP2847566.1 tetratricopeptide repeat protein [Humidesulfovibrio sp.]